MRKILIFIIAILLAAGVLFWLNLDNIIDFAFRRTIKQSLDFRTDIMNDKGVHVITLGSGLPMFNPDRTRPCTAVIAGDQILIFDAGLCASRQIGLMNLPWDRISAVFLTHLHSDHYAGIGALIEERWLWGGPSRNMPLRVYGPAGTDEIVEGFGKAYRINNLIRINALFGYPLEGARGEAHEFSVQGSEKKLLYDNNGLKVFAFVMDHHNPLAVKKYHIDAYGYRIEYAGRVIVLSGDCTFKSRENIVRHSRNADLLLHEAMYDNSQTGRTIRILKEMGQTESAEHVKTAHAHHTTAIEAAQIASESHVKKLVYYHLPVPANFIARWLFLRGTDKVFKGDIVLSEDFMDIYLPPVNVE